MACSVAVRTGGHTEVQSLGLLQREHSEMKAQHSDDLASQDITRFKGGT